MKKIFLLLSITLCFALCSCSVDTSGYKQELTSNEWEAKLESGAEVNLKFSGEKACFSITNAGNQTTIDGNYVADENSFIIFVPNLAQNYRFEYFPRGVQLDLTYNNNKVTLNQKEAK